MTTYRVGEQGATVWHADGRLLGSLPAGVLIVPAVEGVAPAEPDPPDRVYDGKRVRGYPTKVVRPSDDKHVLIERSESTEDTGI